MEQKHLATGLELHVPHVHFFYLFIDYKHKHTATISELTHFTTPHPPTFLIDYKHRHRHTPVQGSSTTQEKPGPL